MTGKISRLNKGSRVSAVENHLQTTYHASFLINGRQILIELHQPILIEEGEMVAIAGQDKNGAFKALAYRNLDTKVSACGPYSLYLGMGVALIIAGSAFLYGLLTGFKMHNLMVELSVVPSIFIMVGGYLIFKGLKIKNALSYLRTFT